jgi:hypothetical protein
MQEAKTVAIFYSMPTQQLAVLDVSHLAAPTMFPRMPTVHPGVVIAVGVLLGFLSVCLG